jgi:phosphate/sulfate permease
MNEWTHTTTSSPSSTMHTNGLAAMGAVLALGIIRGVISTIVTTELLQGVLASWLLPRLWH